MRLEKRLDKAEAAMVPTGKRCVTLEMGDAVTEDEALAEHLSAHPEDAGAQLYVIICDPTKETP